MILERVARRTNEDIDQAIIPHTCEESLFVAQGILSDNARRPIRHFGLSQICVRSEGGIGNENEHVSCGTDTAHDPDLALSRSCLDGRGQRGAIPKAENQIPEILGETDSELASIFDDVITLEAYLRHSG